MKETDEAKATCLESIKVTKEDLVTVRANVPTQAGAVYDLHRTLLADDTEAYWDQNVSDMHTKDPWTDLTGVKKSPQYPMWLKTCLSGKHLFFD